MASHCVHSSASLKGAIAVPGDKSLSHRALMFGALAEGTSCVGNFLEGRDCLATMSVLRALGVSLDRLESGELRLEGRGLYGFDEPKSILDCENSGTTLRLMAGLLCGQPFFSVLTGTKQLRRRPMARITSPLRQMGAVILGRDQSNLAPLALAGSGQGVGLRGIRYEMPVASAQVKSAVLLAGLHAVGPTTVVEPGPARDHTERLLQSMGVRLEIDGPRITVEPDHLPLRPLNFTVPGDISSAAFLLVAGSIVEGSCIDMPALGWNPTRIGIVKALESMGADITVSNERLEAGEPVGDVRVRHSPLEGREFGGSDIVTMIDELPVLALAATQAEGRTVVRDAGELRVKESDRIAVTVSLLKAFGANIEEREDGFVVEGPTKLQGATVSSYDDHRQAMMLTVAGLVSAGVTTVEGVEVIGDSYPGFESDLTRLGARIETASPA